MVRESGTPASLPPPEPENTRVDYSEENEALKLIGGLQSIDLAKFRVIGGIVRFDQTSRNIMKDAKQRIISSFSSQSSGRENFLIWAPPGSGKSFFVQEVVKSIEDVVSYRELNLARLGEQEFRSALLDLEKLDKPRLCFVDEADSKSSETWPYEALLPSLESSSSSGRVRACFVLAGSSGDSLSGMKEGIIKRPKGVDLLSRISPRNEFVIEALGLGDKLLVVSSQFSNAAREHDRRINEIEKLVLFYVALNPSLASARKIRQFAEMCIDRIPKGEDRVKYDHLFDPGDPENKEFWFKASHARNELVNAFVSLEESDRVSLEQRTIKAPIHEIAGPVQEAPATLDSNRIAVLPLSNISPDPNDGYFADGMTEELISTISKIGGLQVIARTSVMRYKGGNKSIEEIGKELKAGTILEGSVRKAGNKLRITVQLIHSNDSRHLWAESYDRELKDVFEIQSDISRTVAESLKIKLVGVESRLVKKEATRNMEAYTLYLRGIQHMESKRIEDQKKAIDYFERAIKLDPNFALAYAGLAQTYSWEPTIAALGLSSREGLAKSRELSLKALEIDEALPEAHASLSNVAWTASGLSREGWLAEGNDLKRAIELNPNYAYAHMLLGVHLLQERNFDGAMVELKTALSLDPLSVQANLRIGQVLMSSGKYEEALEYFQRLLGVLPEQVDFIHASLSSIYLARGRLEEAMEEVKKTMSLLEKEDEYAMQSIRTILAIIYARQGKKDEARKIQREQQALAEQKNDPYFLVQSIGIYPALGETDEAFRMLSKMVRDNKSPALGWLNVYLHWNDVRSDPRFQEFLAEIGQRDLIVNFERS